MTSAAPAGAYLAAIDRSARTVSLVDPVARQILTTHALAGIPDYVRFEPSTSTLWVTEPDEGENLRKLEAYAWPGNVRELKNTLARAVALGANPDGPARFADLVFNVGPATSMPATIGFEFPGVAEPMPFKDAKAQLIESFERAYVGALRKRHPNNVQRAADAAGLSRKHLYDLLKRVEGRDPET